MKHIFFILGLLLPLISYGQFTPRQKTALPMFLIAGQSNAENFWNANAYSASTARMGLQLEDSLQNYWGVPKVQQLLYASAGKGLAVNPADVDWNINSVGELYDGCFYNLLCDSVRSSANDYWGFLIENGYAPYFRFVIWIQGETDAANTDFANAYQQNLIDLIRAFRMNLKAPSLPFIVVKLGDDINRPTATLNTVRTAMQNVADSDPNVYIISIDDFSQTGAEYNGPTNVHYSENGLLKILQRVVNIAKLL